MVQSIFNEKPLVDGKTVIDNSLMNTLKTISELIIDDKYRFQERLQEKDYQISQLESKDQEIYLLKMTILEIKNNIL